MVKRPAPALGPEQLRAHDGIGVAAGWAAVDAGDARVFVPQSWIDFSFSGCTRDVPSSGSVSIGEIAVQTCDHASHLNNAPPTEAVALVPSTVKPTGRVVEVVHGYRVYAAPTAHLHPGWTVYDVPQLDLEIALRGSLQSQVLVTLAPSSRVVALAFAAQSAPTGHAYAVDGVRLTIPTTWPRRRRNELPVPLARTIPGARAGLLRIAPNVVFSNCQLLTAQDMRAFHDGVYLFLGSQSRTAPTEPTTAPVAVLHHGETTLRVYTEPGDSPSQLDVFFRRAGSTVHPCDRPRPRDQRPDRRGSAGVAGGDVVVPRSIVTERLPAVF